MADRYSEYQREEERKRNRDREHDEGRTRANPEDQSPTYYREPSDRGRVREDERDETWRSATRDQPERYEGQRNWREPDYNRNYGGSEPGEGRNREWGSDRERPTGVQSRMVARISDEERRWRERQQQNREGPAADRERQNRELDWDQRDWSRGRVSGREQQRYGRPENIESSGYDEYRQPDQYRQPSFSREETLTERVGRFVGIGPKGYKRSDARILEDVSERLEDHPAIDASEIEVRVENGEVTLSGSVDNRGSKRLAEDIAANCRGVRDVHNQIRVASERIIGQREPGKGGQERVA